ncbi:MAG: hypothetical protein ABI843_02415 [Dokdonella sp.]
MSNAEPPIPEDLRPHLDAAIYAVNWISHYRDPVARLQAIEEIGALIAFEIENTSAEASLVRIAREQK